MTGFLCEDLPEEVRVGIFQIIPARFNEALLLHPVHVVGASAVEAHDFHQHAVVNEAVKDLSNVGPVVEGVIIPVVAVTWGAPVLGSRQ